MFKSLKAFALSLSFFCFAFLSNGQTAYGAPEPIEYLLATINAGTYVQRDDITVKRFRSLLDQLSQKYVEDEQQIADMTVKIIEILKEKGISEKPLAIMEGMNSLFYSAAKLHYVEYVSTYVTLRDSGKSHEAAVIGLRMLLRALGVR